MGSSIRLTASDGHELGDLYDAGHGFNCDRRGSYDEASAKLAREPTMAFFAANLG